ncbi:hypothetical protein B0A55_06675 [Friedmanniomyces simplex]|uniref:Uncharacterized protein n=1 Tax=Friedmanniomyces simplex TaxID=329884 RepID=A0A4U0XGA3_9PEZI|nr:hypothetical protein B0A55_06675 [Friedmanniomyces simplex]
MEAATATATHPPLDDDMALRVRQTIDVTRGVAKYLKHAIILPVALTGCGLMICGMYVWLGTLCVLRWLLLMTVALLRECLELPDSDVLSARANTVPSGRSTGHAVTAGSGERVAQERLKQTLESQSQHTAVDTVYGGNVKRVDSPLGDHDETSEQAPRRRLEANWDLKPVDMGVEPKSDWEDETRHEVAFKPMNISPGWDLISHRGAAAHTMDGLDTTADWKTRAPGRTRPTPPQVETSAEKQSNWLVSMSAGPLTSEPTHEVRVNTYRVDSSVPGIAGENGKPTVYTAEQLAEATNFIREVAKGGHARKTSCTQKASPAKPVPPVTYRQVATPSRTPKAPLPSSRRPWPAVPSAPQQATVSAANPKDNVPPPHVRAQQAALAKRSSGNDTKQDPTAPVKARGPAVRVAGPNMYDVLQVESPTASVPSTPSKPATTQVDAAAESKSVIERSKHPTEDMPTPPSVLAIQATEMQEDTPVSPSQTATVPTALDPQRGEHGCVAESESTADAVELQAAREQTERGMKGSLAAVPQASSRGASLSGREDSSSSSGFHGDDLLDLDREWELKMLKDATRKELARAWWGREGVRKKLLGTWSLEGQQALEAATLAYSEQRAALQDIMSGGKLNAEDASTFPELSSRDLAMPKVRPPFIPAEGLRKEGEAEPKGKEAEEESGENKRWADHFKKTELALGLYHDACADFKRPQSQGRKYPRYGVATGKAKMVRAKNYYRKRREMFEAAFPDHAMLITAFPAVDALE